MSSTQSLLNILTTNGKIIEKAYTSNKLRVPSLDHVSPPSALDEDPKVIEAKQLLVAAALQLVGTVRHPAETVMSYAGGMFTTAVLGFVVEVNIPDILKEHGEKGLHVSEISAKCGVDASYIARVLRYLTTRHVCKEVTPNMFTNNAVPTLLLKAKSLDEITSDADEMLKSIACISQFLQNPGNSKTPFNMAHGTDKTHWDWYQEDWNIARSRRFTSTMTAGTSRFPPQLFTTAIGKLALKPNDVVVNVGGSIGTLVDVLKDAHPELNYVVQDLQRQIEDAEKVWKERDAEAIKVGKVKFQVHDFFTPQPVKNAAVYVLRLVIHDWADDEAVKILSLLRDAAGPDTQVIIFDEIAQHTCPDPDSEYISRKVPELLLANLGETGGVMEVTSLDFQMLTMMNGRERTVGEFKTLGESITGWKLEDVTPGLLHTFVFSAA